MANRTPRLHGNSHPFGVRLLLSIQAKLLRPLAAFALKRSTTCCRFYGRLRLHGSRAFVCRIVKVLRRISRMDAHFFHQATGKRDLILGHHPKYFVRNARAGVCVLNNTITKWSDEELLAFLVYLIFAEEDLRSPSSRGRKWDIDSTIQRTREWLEDHGRDPGAIDGFFVPSRKA